MLVSPLVVIEALKGGVIGILLTVDTLIYGLISSAFKIFMAIAGARLLSSEVYYEIANKLYIVIGVLMLFVLAYSLLKGIVDPDQTLKNELGPKTVKNIIVAVIGLAITPVLFNLMYQAQGVMLENDILAKIFFRSDSSETYEVNGEELNPDEYVDTVGGAVTAVNIWQAFFYPAEDSGKEAKDISADVSDFYVNGVGHLAVAGLAAAGLAVGASLTTIPVVGWIIGGALIVGSIFAASQDFSDGAEFNDVFPDGKITLEQAYQMASGGEGFNVFTVFLPNYLDDGEITYYFLLSTIAGAFVLYAFVSFSIDMGVRAAKLAFLQIIAPVPLVMNVVPKSEKRLEKYVGIVVSTFMEVFVRIAVVYVVVFIICHLTELFSSVGGLWGNEELNTPEKMFALAFLILGLIAFCHSAPGFISQALGLDKGTMDGLGLKPSDFKKKLTDGGAVHARAIAGGGLRAGLKNWKAGSNLSRKDQILSAIGGFGSGLARGAAYAATNKMEWGKGKEYAAKAAADAEQARIARSDRTEDAQTAAKDVFKTEKDRYNAANENYKKAREAFALAKLENDPKKLEEAENNLKLAAAERDVAARNLSEARRKVWSTQSAITAKAAEIDKKISIAYSPSIDTSFMDARAKLYSDLRSLEGTLEDTVGRDEAVQRAMAARNQLEYKQADTFAYEVYQDDMASRMSAARRELGNKQILDSKDTLTAMSAEHKKIMLQAAGVELDPSISDTELSVKFDSALSSGDIDYEVVTKVCEQNIDIQSAIGFSRVSENDVRIKAGVMTQDEFVASGELKKYQERGQERRGDEITAAEKKLKTAKKDAVTRKLAEAVSGIENDTSRALSKFFADHKGEFDDHLGAILDSDTNEIIGTFLRDNFGSGVTYGTVDMGAVFLSSPDGVQVSLSGEKNADGTEPSGKIIRKKDKEGNLTKKIGLEVNGVELEDEFDLSTPDGLHRFRQAVKAAKLTKTESKSDGKAEGATVKLKDKAEKQGDAYRSDVEYQTAHRSAAVSENKDKK